MKKAIPALLLAATLAGCAHLARPACPASPGAEADIERAVHAFYDALRSNDPAAFRRITTTRFYSFDGGDRFVGTQLSEFIIDARSKGRQFNWSVGPLDTQRRCTVAWTAWENVGSAGTPGDVRSRRWLESAVLVYEDGAWKVDFFHSHPARPR